MEKTMEDLQNQLEANHSESKMLCNPSSITKMKSVQLATDSNFVSDIAGERELDSKDFTDYLLQLSSNFNVNFADRESNEYIKAKGIFDRCKNLGWSANEFNERLEIFLDTCVWKNFNRADFMNWERPQLYDYSWYLENCKNKKIYFYTVLRHGEELYFYSDKFYENIKQTQPRAGKVAKTHIQEPPENKMSEADQINSKLFNENFELVCKTVALEKQVDLMQQKIDFLTGQLEKMAEASELERISSKFPKLIEIKAS
jgi:hypothetical protein